MVVAVKFVRDDFFDGERHMNFTAWYVLFIVWTDQSGIHSAAAPKVDLETCQHDAVRVIAALPKDTSKWACHEMTVDVQPNGYVEIKFPNN